MKEQTEKKKPENRQKTMVHNIQYAIKKGKRNFSQSPQFRPEFRASCRPLQNVLPSTGLSGRLQKGNSPCNSLRKLFNFQNSRNNSPQLFILHIAFDHYLPPLKGDLSRASRHIAREKEDNIDHKCEILCRKGALLRINFSSRSSCTFPVEMQHQMLLQIYFMRAKAAIYSLFAMFANYAERFNIERLFCKLTSVTYSPGFFAFSIRLFQ